MKIDESIFINMTQQVELSTTTIFLKMELMYQLVSEIAIQDRIKNQKRQGFTKFTPNTVTQLTLQQYKI